MEKLFSKKNQIKSLLKASKHLRDNDMQLIAKVWAIESGLSESNPILKKIAEGKLTAADTITRNRRKIQEENPSLRGNSYKERQKRAINIKRMIAK